MNAIRVIGIGSAFGNDNIGWRVIEQLRQRLAGNPLYDAIELIDSDRPGINLIHMLKDARYAILIDAVLDADNHGQIMQISSKQLMDETIRISSHDLDVASAITLAAKLQSLPQCLQIIGLGIDASRLQPIGAAPINKLVDTVETALDNYIHCHTPA